jgi:Coenzyme PQQ synthesis protein D (PqqD)
MMIQKREGWLAAKVGPELIMMSVESGAYLGLNEVGARVWEMIDTRKEISELCAGLAEEFEVSAEACRAEVESFLAELESRGAILRRD